VHQKDGEQQRAALARVDAHARSSRAVTPLDKRLTMDATLRFTKEQLFH
jgi:hypothetical protein